MPDKIGAFGFSAGGHLTALLGTLDGEPGVRVQAVVAASAPPDLTLYRGGDIVPRLIGATFVDKPELFRAASAINYVTPDDPPFFLYHGTDDHTVSPEHTQRFKAALDRSGVRNEVRWVKGRGACEYAVFQRWGRRRGDRFS
jgi:dipeptidyl aminopeptidase/acylaminoacyl peptidase